MRIDALIAQVVAEHFPNPPTQREEVLAFERTVGYSLPQDMRQFYLACDGASLFRPKGECPPFELLRLRDIQRARQAVYGTDEAQYGPEYHFAFCDRGDGDFVGIDLRERPDGKREILDVWHESYPEDCEVIAVSFESFLDGALHSGGDSLFWFRDEAHGAD